MLDIKLEYFKDIDGYDFDIENSDFKHEDSFGTSIILSLFLDARATEKEVPNASRRRGYWANYILNEDNLDFDTGSKLWLLDGRKTTNTLNKANDYAKKSLSWMLFDDVAKDVNVTGEFINEGIKLQVTYKTFENDIKNENYIAWNKLNF